MSEWRTTETIGTCLTCGWGSEDCDNPRRSSAEAVQHQRECPDHEVHIDREQTRRVRVRRNDR